MKIKELLEVLKKQYGNFKDLSEIVKEKKEVLINNEYENLFDVTSKEEQILLKIQFLEEERLLIMNKIFKEYKINSDEYKIEILIDGIKDKVRPEILKVLKNYEMMIKTTLNNVTLNNELNMMLIQQSRNLINETMQAIVNIGSKQSLVDRKG